MTMAKVTSQLPHDCRPFSCYDEWLVDGASAPQCGELPVISTTWGAEGLQVLNIFVYVIHQSCFCRSNSSVPCALVSGTSLDGRKTKVR